MSRSQVPGATLLQIYYSVQPLIKGSSGWGQETPRRAGVAGGALCPVGMGLAAGELLGEGRGQRKRHPPPSAVTLSCCSGPGTVDPCALSLCCSLCPRCHLAGTAVGLTRATGRAGQGCPTAGTVLLCPCPGAWPLGAHGSRKSALGGASPSPRGADPVTGLLTLPRCSSQPPPVFCNRSSGFYPFCR